MAREAASEIIERDPMLEDEYNRIYKRQLDIMRSKAQNWSGIS